jgi:hypothetical protein
MSGLRWAVQGEPGWLEAQLLNLPLDRLTVQRTRGILGMIEEFVEDFLLAGVRRVYPGQWKTPAPGLFSTIESQGYGIILIHDRQQGFFGVGVGVLGGVKYGEDLVRAVGKLNHSLVLGSYVLSEGQEDHWSVTYAIKLRYGWLDPQSGRSAKLVMDVLNAPIGFAERGVEEIQPRFGGEPWGVEAGWPMALLGNF